MVPGPGEAADLNPIGTSAPIGRESGSSALADPFPTADFRGRLAVKFGSGTLARPAATDPFPFAGLYSQLCWSVSRLPKAVTFVGPAKRIIRHSSGTEDAQFEENSSV